MRYVFDHPEMLDQIPPGAHLVILPTDDPELAAENTTLLNRFREAGHPVVIVRMATPRPLTPHVEVA
jgi:hypothetical protein